MSQIIQPQENLVLYESFITLWLSTMVQDHYQTCIYHLPGPSLILIPSPEFVCEELHVSSV